MVVEWVDGLCDQDEDILLQSSLEKGNYFAASRASSLEYAHGKEELPKGDARLKSCLINECSVLSRQQAQKSG